MGTVCVKSDSKKKFMQTSQLETPPNIIHGQGQDEKIQTNRKTASLPVVTHHIILPETTVNILTGSQRNSLGECTLLITYSKIPTY